MIKKTRIILSFIRVSSLFFLFLIYILQVNAETKVIAKYGDTLFKLSKRYGVTLKELMHRNNFNDANKLIEGKVIIIPQESKTDERNIYRVIEGDTLYKISRDYKVTVKDIISINNLDNLSFIKTNQIIVLPRGAIKTKIANQENIKSASKKVFYHQTSKAENLIDIAHLHNITTEEIVTLNKLNNKTKVDPNTKLKIRKNSALKSLKYGSLLINWSEWVYLDGNYITQAKNRKNKSFYLAINCGKRTLNNTLNNSYWGKWYFPTSDFEFQLINDFCDHSL